MKKKTARSISIILTLLYCSITLFVSAGYATDAAAGAAAGNAAGNAADAHSAAITVTPGGESQYKAIRLTPPIYNAANSNLSDILIKDNNGENTPYFINSGTKDVSSRRETYPMDLINAYLKDDNYYFDYKLAAEGSGDTISSSIEFTTGNNNFAKEVDVYGSYDNIHWDYVQNDILYSIEGRSKLSIDFWQPQKYTHIRLKLANNLERVAFNEVRLVYVINIFDEKYFIEDITPAFNVENGDKSTNIIVEGLKHLRLYEITIQTDSMFQRVAYTPNGTSKELYNLSLNGTSYSDTTIPLYWQIPTEDNYVITIMDADDKPIQVNGISVRYYADEVIFEAAQDKTYTLEFRGDPTIAAPIYDIARYKEEILKGEIDRAAIGEISYAPIVEIPPERDYQFIFNIVIVAVALLLGAVTIMRLRKKR